MSEGQRGKAECATVEMAQRVGEDEKKIMMELWQFGARPGLHLGGLAFG
jgi:hypothetical protein